MHDQEPVMTRILVVEDNPVNQKVTVAQLEKFGYDVQVADNGEQAFNLYEKKDFDLILMDCQMPVLDGFEATRKIREKDGEKHHTPIIALTAHAFGGDREKCLEAGMDDFVVKPVRADFLNNTVKKWLSAEELSAISEAMLLDLFGEGAEAKEFIKKVAPLFLDDAPQHLAAIQKAAQQSNAKDLEESARALKGSAGSMGAFQLQTLCGVLMNKAREGELKGITENIEQVILEYDRVKKELKEKYQEASVANEE